MCLSFHSLCLLPPTSAVCPSVQCLRGCHPHSQTRRKASLTSQPHLHRCPPRLPGHAAPASLSGVSSEPPPRFSVYIHEHTHLHVHTCTYTCTCIYVYTYTHTYAYTYTYTYISTYTQLHMHMSPLLPLSGQPPLACVCSPPPLSLRGQAWAESELAGTRRSPYHCVCSPEEGTSTL